MKLDLDFKQRNASTWGRWALLLLGIGLTVEMTISYQTLSRELAAYDARRHTVKAKPAEGRTEAALKADQGLKAEIERAVAAMDDLARPWETLFEALESLDFEHVALLSVQPDVETRLITLTGEAKAYPDLLTYVARLKMQAAFTSVILANHEIRENDPHRPYFFTTRAHWKSTP